MTDALKACVIGYPIHHSRSPLIHNHWIKGLGVNGYYGIESIAPDDLPSFLAALKTGQSDYRGGNATLPHKERLLELADEADDAALQVGAANTFWVKNGRLHVTNTDVHGFLANLDAQTPAPPWDQTMQDKKKAVVLGAGGAARAIVSGLIQRGFDQIHIANRTLARAEALCQGLTRRAGLSDTVLSPIGWAQAQMAQEGASLLVNTTSLGMSGQPPLRHSLEGLPLEATVTDIVYTPLKTDLLKQAEARGHRAIDGLGMLLHQAVPGFETWFGIKPEVTKTLRALVEQDMQL